jgi:hypothetical protein
MLAATVAAVPHRRSLAGAGWPFLASVSPRNPLRDVPTRIGKAQFGKFRKSCEQFVILHKAFAEADSRIDHDLRFPYARFARDSDGLLQATDHVLHYITGERSFLHGARAAAHVHENQRSTELGGNLRETRIAAQAGNVVDDFRAGAEGDFRDRGFLRVYGDRNFQFAAQRFEHRQQAAQLNGSGDWLRTGASGLRADVDDVGAIPLHGK